MLRYGRDAAPNTTSTPSSARITASASIIRRIEESKALCYSFTVQRDPQPPLAAPIPVHHACAKLTGPAVIEVVQSSPGGATAHDRDPDPSERHSPACAVLFLRPPPGRAGHCRSLPDPGRPDRIDGRRSYRHPPRLQNEFPQRTARRTGHSARAPSRERRADELSRRSEERRVGKECRCRWSAYD